MNCSTACTLIFFLIKAQHVKDIKEIESGLDKRRKKSSRCGSTYISLLSHPYAWACKFLFLDISVRMPMQWDAGAKELLYVDTFDCQCMGQYLQYFFYGRGPMHWMQSKVKDEDGRIGAGEGEHRSVLWTVFQTPSRHNSFLIFSPHVGVTERKRPCWPFQWKE